MSLISQANLITLTDRLAGIWDLLKPKAGLLANVASPVSGTAQKAAYEASALINSIGDYDPIRDMAAEMYNLSQVTNIEGLFAATGVTTAMRTALTAINTHVQRMGPAVDASAISLATLLTYRNTTRFTSMVAPTFGDLWYAVFGTRLPVAGVLSPAIHPSWNTAGSAHGMGSRAVGGSYTDGDNVDTTKYSEVEPLVEVTVNFADSSAPPSIVIAGTDHTGVTSTTWTATGGSNNPAAAVSTTTSEAITAQTRQVVTLASAAGIVDGSVLTISAGNDDEEVVVVEAISSNDVTCVFLKAHDSGATVTGNTTLTCTPSVAGRRIVSVSGITITAPSATAGTVRVVGKQDRVPV